MAPVVELTHTSWKASTLDVFLPPSLLGAMLVIPRQDTDAALPPHPPPALSPEGAEQLITIHDTRKRLLSLCRAICQRLIVLYPFLDDGQPNVVDAILGYWKLDEGYKPMATLKLEPWLVKKNFVSLRISSLACSRLFAHAWTQY